MSASFNTANLIPGHHVTYALADLEVAVWAHPGFAVIRVRANAGLGRVFNTALYLGASQTQPNS